LKRKGKNKKAPRSNDRVQESTVPEVGQWNTAPDLLGKSSDVHLAPLVAHTDREVTTVPAPLEQMLEELRKAEQARDLLTELERRLAAGDQRALERYLTQLDQVAQSLPEADPMRLLIESAVGAARMQDAIQAGSDVSRSRSAIEGEISTLQGAIQGIQARADS
jgi:hypothetical protein